MRYEVVHHATFRDSAHVVEWLSSTHTYVHSHTQVSTAKALSHLVNYISDRAYSKGVVTLEDGELCKEGMELSMYQVLYLQADRKQILMRYVVRIENNYFHTHVIPMSHAYL